MRRPRVLAAAASLALVLPLTGTAAAGPRVVGTAPLTVTVDAMSPVSGSDGATLTLRGTVRNSGAVPLSGLRVVLGTGSAPENRAGLLRDFGDPPGIVRVLTRCQTCLPTSLPAGAVASYSLSVPLGRQLDVGVVEVYPLIVRVEGSAGVDLGEAQTFLPYVPASVSAPLRVGWVLPLDPDPVQGADGGIADGDFPASLDAGGALAELVRAATPGGTAAPVTWAIEPSLLDAAAETANPGWHRSGSTATQQAQAGSAAFLATVATATRGRDVLALPYGDPDAVAVTRAGLGFDLTSAIAVGRADLGRALPDARVLDGMAWVPGTGVDQATLDAYAAGGITSVVVPGGQLPPLADAFPPTQSAVTELPTQGPVLQGLATDPDLEALLEGGGHDQPTTTMSAQRVLAMLALSLGEYPNDRLTRDVVLAVPRGVGVSAGWLRELLAATGSVSWLSAHPLGDLLGDLPGSRAALGAYPASARAAELPASTLTGAADSVSRLRGGVTALATALPDSTLTAPLNEALLRAESYAWRADPADGARLRAGVAARTAQLLAGIRLASAPTVTLASRHAAVPVTVENTLPEAATVRLTLASTDPTKLRSSAQQVVIPANKKVRVLLTATTGRAGTFVASVAMTTPAGLRITQAPITIHSRAYGVLSLAITIGALGVLVVAILLRAGRRARARLRRRAT